MSPAESVIQPAMSRLEALVNQFHNCLTEEARVLASWPPQGLWPIQEEKVRLVRDLENAHTALRAALKAQGKDLSSPASLGPTLLPVWQTLRERLLHCQTLNSTHEKCLEKQQVALKQSLELLLLKLNQDVTYGRQGHCQSVRRMGSIGRA